MRIFEHAPDYYFVVFFFVLIIFGLLMLSSATSVLGYQKFDDSYWYLKHQLTVGFLPGLLFFLILSRINYRFWIKLSPFLLFISVFLLILVFVPGIGASYGRARSWLNIFGFSLQPSEIVKLTFLLYLCAWLEKRRERVHTFAYGLIPFLIYLGLITGLIILQPDTGTMFIILLFSLAVYYAGGAKMTHMIMISLGGLSALVALVKLAPYRMARLAAFLDPGADPQGIGYHINQAFIAIGSGGFWGLGLGRSRQKFQYLPEVPGDSIFAVVAEELGFFVSFILLAAFLFIFLRLIKIAAKSESTFASLFVTGYAVWLVGQTFVNIGAMVGVMPLTGLPLPLISYGGTALMSLMAGAGIVVNISRQTKTAFFPRIKK